MIVPTDSPSRVRLAAAAFAAATMGAVVLWAYWPTLTEIAWCWSHDPRYSHGYLVPAFALYLLWTRRQHFLNQEFRPAVLGLALLAAATLRLAGTYFHYVYLDQISLLPCIAGLVALAAGWPALTCSWPAIAFLAFMVPLPHTWSLALSGPMQTVATVSSTFVLQVLGRPAIAEGNVIQLNEITLGIVEACSGLRMLVVFFALSTAVALLIRKPLWEKVLIACSAIPIALASNILRITLTGVLFEILGDGYGGHLFHDVAGWLMMPLGLVFLGIELFVLGKLLLEPGDGRPLPSQISLQQVDISSVAMYKGGNSPRRERRGLAAPGPAEPAAESVAQS